MPVLIRLYTKQETTETLVAKKSETLVASGSDPTAIKKVTLTQWLTGATQAILTSYMNSIEEGESTPLRYVVRVTTLYRVHEFCNDYSYNCSCLLETVKPHIYEYLIIKGLSSII